MGMIDSGRERYPCGVTLTASNGREAVIAKIVASPLSSSRPLKAGDATLCIGLKHLPSKARKMLERT